MALICCPECGHELSDTLNTCINCGVGIIYCPKCKTPAKAIFDTCSNCGFEFKKEKEEEAVKHEQDAQVSTMEAEDHVEEESNDLFSIFKKIREQVPMRSFEKARKISFNAWMAITAIAIILLPNIMLYNLSASSIPRIQIINEYAIPYILLVIVAAFAFHWIPFMFMEFAFYFSKVKEHSYDIKKTVSILKKPAEKITAEQNGQMDYVKNFIYCVHFKKTPLLILQRALTRLLIIAVLIYFATAHRLLYTTGVLLGSSANSLVFVIFIVLLMILALTAVMFNKHRESFIEQLKKQ